MGDLPSAPEPLIEEEPVIEEEVEISAVPSTTPPRGRPPSGQKEAVRESGLSFVAPLPEDLSLSFLSKLSELSRGVSGEMHDDEIVQRYVGALAELLPERRVVVRLLAPGSGELGLVFANGRLLSAHRERISLSVDAIERFGLAPEQLNEAGVEIDPSYRSSFEEGPSAPGGIEVPLLDGRRLLGVLALEHLYTPHVVERRIVEHLALMLSHALRNARLNRESGYLRRRLAKLMEHAAAPILVLDRRRQVSAVNRALLSLIGHERESLVGRDFLGLLAEKERPRALRIFLRALAGEASTNFELAFPRSGGGVARVALNAVPVYSPEGEADGLMAIGTDRTEVRDLEQQIAQAEKLATLGQLAAGIVHELNNPLTSISVYSEYLLRKGEKSGVEERDLEKMRRIRESAERVLRFTRDLMTYARPSSEEPSLLVVRDVLARSILFCEHIIREVGARVETDYAEGLPPFRGIKGQLHQVFINLITNACHALPKGTGRLLLAAAVEDDGDEERRRLLVVVEDNGRGVPEAARDKIFAPFFSTKQEGKGTGLGLSIVKGIVERHRGTIEIAHSSAERGTRFEVRLPLNYEDHGEEE